MVSMTSARRTMNSGTTLIGLLVLNSEDSMAYLQQLQEIFGSGNISRLIKSIGTNWHGEGHYSRLDGNNKRNICQIRMDIREALDVQDRKK